MIASLLWTIGAVGAGAGLVWWGDNLARPRNDWERFVRRQLRDPRFAYWYYLIRVQLWWRTR